MQFRELLIPLSVRSVFACTGTDDDSTMTTTALPEGGKNIEDRKGGGKGNENNDEPDTMPDLNAFDNHPGMTFLMTTSGIMKGFYTNHAGTEYRCDKPHPPKIMWSKFGPMGTALFYDRKVLMCGISTDQKTITPEMGCAYLEKVRKGETRWKPLAAKLPKEMQKSGIGMIFVGTPLGIIGAINKGNTISKTFRLPGIEAKEWKEGPNFPDSKVISDYCLIMSGSYTHHLLIGGRVEGKSQKKVYISTWKSTKIWKTSSKYDMPEARYSMACGFRRTFKDKRGVGNVLVVGGIGSNGEVLRTSYSFNLGTSKWEELPRFSFFRNRSGIVGGAFTIYYNEPLLLGGHIKSKNGLTPNIDYFHLLTVGDPKKEKAIWTKLMRPTFPSLKEVFFDNTVLFDVSPSNLPGCEKRQSKGKDGRRTYEQSDYSKEVERLAKARKGRRQYGPWNPPFNNPYCPIRYNIPQPPPRYPWSWEQRPCCTWNHGPSIYPQPGCGPHCGEDCNCGYCGCEHYTEPNCFSAPCRYCPPPRPVPQCYPPPIPPMDVYVTVRVTVTDCRTRGYITNAAVHCQSGCSHDYTEYSERRDGTTTFASILTLAYLHMIVSHEEYESKNLDFQVHGGAPVIEQSICLDSTVKHWECGINCCDTCDGRRGSTAKFNTRIVLNWQHIPRDLNLQLTEYEDKGFQRQTCRVNADSYNLTVEQTCKKGSKSVKMVTANSSFGWDPEVIGFTKRSNFYYAIEVYDYTPTSNMQHNIDYTEYNIFHSRASVDLVDKKTTKTIFITNIENLFELNTKLSHWFVGCFHGNAPLTKPSNFITVNQGFAILPDKKGTTQFLTQAIHKQYCGGKLK